ncbi:hypothetical protein GJAV_G00243340 [Gymnothorax javanicus]|nr:hypothetical protein GJAV_G00243340 [Gymnothorax javanicus]
MNSWCLQVWKEDDADCFLYLGDDLWAGQRVFNILPDVRYNAVFHWAWTRWDVHYYSSPQCMEWIDIEHRKLVGILEGFSWTIGSLMLTGIAYLVNDWRWLVITITSPLAVAILLWRWVPESARWLIVNGKIDKAHYLLQMCAKVNRREGFSEKIKPETLASIVEPEKVRKTHTYLDLVRTPKMRRMALCTGILWYGVFFTLFGISLNITGLGINIHLTQLAYASIEIPANLGMYYLVDRIGRRPAQVGALLGVGICLALNIFVPKEMLLFRTVIATIGKGCSAASFFTVLLFTAELYPTVVRQNGIGYNSSVGRLAISMAPLAMLLDAVWKPLPQVLMCALTLMAALIASFLPETKGKRLPETIEDVEQTRKGHLHAHPED